MAYNINICMYSSAKMERDDVLPFYCLLEKYLENESNKCKVEYGEVHVMKTLSKVERADFLVEYKMKVTASNIINSVTKMMELQIRQKI